MSPQSFIFIGRSGCGKGTQVELLMKVLKEKDPARDILYIQTGQALRLFIQGDSITANKTKEIYNVGGLMPEFLSVSTWTKLLIENYKGNEHIIFDGTPRKRHEAGVLDSVFAFYGFGKTWVINIEISPEEAVKRLLLRKRMDDLEDVIKKRLAWYETDVVPTIGYYRDNSSYNFIEIDGQRSVEEIHEDIIGKIGLR